MKTFDEVSPVLSVRTGSGTSVLVVDDEAAVRRFTARVLEREGYGVLQACDGVEALELIQGSDPSIGVVVSDIVMPRMNGVELMKELGRSHPDLPFILMSGYATAALSERGIIVPCSILAKPFPAERLLEEVERCIRRSGQ